MVALYRRIRCLSWSCLLAVLSGSRSRFCVRPILEYAVDSEWRFLAAISGWVYGFCFPAESGVVERTPLAGDAWVVCVHCLARLSTPPGSMKHKIKVPNKSLQPTPGGVGRSADAGHVVVPEMEQQSRCTAQRMLWLSFCR